MSELPGQEPLDGAPEVSMPVPVEDLALKAERFAAAAEKRPVSTDEGSSVADQEQRGITANPYETDQAARQARQAARLAAIRADIAAGGAKLEDQNRAYNASRVQGPPPKPVLRSERPATTPTPADNGEGGERLAEALRENRLAGIPAEHQLNTEDAARKWIEQRDKLPETD